METIIAQALNGWRQHKTIRWLIAGALILISVFNIGATVSNSLKTTSISNTTIKWPAKSQPTLDSIHLFGETPKQTVIPTTALNIELSGIAVNPAPGNASYAVIKDKNTGQSHLYKIGDTIPGGAQIQAIYPNHVILNNAGELEKLSLPYDSLGEQS